MPLNESRYINKANVSVNDKAFDSMLDADNSDATHAALAVAGMAPGPTGMIADITDAALYAKEKRWKDMGWALVGAIPIIGQFANYKKAVKSIQATKRIREVAKYERMTESIDNGSLLFANEKWQKAIDAGDMWLNKSGDMIGKVGTGIGTKIGNIYEMTKYDRYRDYYKLQKKVMAETEKVWKTLTPAEKALGKELGKSPTIKKELRDIVLKMEKSLPTGD